MTGRAWSRSAEAQAVRASLSSAVQPPRRRRYSPAVEALHREGWEGAIVEGPAAIARFYEGERGAPCPGRDALLARLVRVACWWTGHEARTRLAAARMHSGATEGTATPLRAS